MLQQDQDGANGGTSEEMKKNFIEGVNNCHQNSNGDGQPDSVSKENEQKQGIIHDNLDQNYTTPAEL